MGHPRNGPEDSEDMKSSLEVGHQAANRGPPLSSHEPTHSSNSSLSLQSL